MGRDDGEICRRGECSISPAAGASNHPQLSESRVRQQCGALRHSLARKALKRDPLYLTGTLSPSFHLFIYSLLK